MGPGPFTPDPLGGTWPAPFPWLSFGFSGPVPGFSLKTISGPTVEPVDVTTAKANARVDYTVEDALFAIWITAAREWLETETNCRLVNQTLEMRLPGWPMDGQVRLGIAPVSSVISLQYYAPAAPPLGGVLTTLTEGVDFQTWLDYRPPLVLPFPGRYWPTVQYGRVPAVICQFVAGYGAAASAVPQKAVQAILMLVTYWAENRGDQDAPQKLGVPPGVRRLAEKLDLGGYR